jgi:hypothetical protein
MKNLLILLLVTGGAVMYRNDMTPTELLNEYVAPVYELVVDFIR